MALAAAYAVPVMAFELMTVQTRQAVGFQPCSSGKQIISSSAFCLADAMEESPGEQRDLGHLTDLQGLPV